MTGATETTWGRTISRLLDVATLVTLAAAIVVAVVPSGFVGQVVARERSAWEARKHWDSLVHMGSAMGAADEPVRWVYFGSYTCEHCRQFQIALERELTLQPELSIAYMHFLPTSLVPRGEVAAACAEPLGHFMPMHRFLYATSAWQAPDADWGAIATSVGIANVDAFAECMDQGRAMQRLHAQREWAERVGVVATPTLLGPDGRPVRGRISAEEALTRRRP